MRAIERDQDRAEEGMFSAPKKRSPPSRSPAKRLDYVSSVSLVFYVLCKLFTRRPPDFFIAARAAVASPSREKILSARNFCARTG